MGASYMGPAGFWTTMVVAEGEMGACSSFAIKLWRLRVGPTARTKYLEASEKESLSLLYTAEIAVGSRTLKIRHK
jgi:hypothetical protein